MSCVFVTIAAMETQQCVVYCSAVTANNMKSKSVAQKYFYGSQIAGNNETYFGLHAKCPV
jgi:hypothetical protein